MSTARTWAVGTVIAVFVPRCAFRRTAAARTQKLECGLLGAVIASIVFAFLSWLALQLSVLSLIIR